MKCAASWEFAALMSSSAGTELAVVSQRPGSRGSIGLGKIGVDMGTGICSDSDKAGVRWTWAILELDIQLKRVEIAFARLDCDRIN